MHIDIRPASFKGLQCPKPGDTACNEDHIDGPTDGVTENQMIARNAFSTVCILLVYGLSHY